MPVILRATCALLVALCVGCAAQAAPAPTETFKLPMADGVRLATDVYLPHGQGPWPVVLARSTYGRTFDANEYLSRGIAAVVQDVRGMGESEGDKHVFFGEGWRPEARDGAETVQWIHAQPWCNGKVATWGGSALGITQTLLAPATDGLVAQYIDVAPGSLYHHCAYQGGVFRKNMLEGWLTMIGQPHMIGVYKGEPRYSAYWSYFDADARAEDITAPALFVGGWYDIFAQGTIDAFEARERRGGEGARGRNMLIMKWSPHGPDVSPDYQFNPNRTEDLRVSEVRRAFYRAHLLGDPAALEKFPKVHYYVMGDDAPGAPGSEWRTADAWPPYPTVATAFHLRADSSLATGDPGENGALGYTFDPADPYPTLGGANLLPNLPSGPFDQRPHSATRTDLLKFATPPLDAPLEITGRMTLRLHVSSDAPDTDFTAKVVDIFPDGREISLTDSIRRVKSRLGLDQIAPLLEGPEQVVELEIDLWSIAWIFNTGHRIGLHVSSSNFPRFEINPNTGDDFPGEGVTPRPARNQVHTGPAHPSALVLPVRPAAN